MNSCNCNKPKCEPSKCRTDGFVFRKVVIPAQLGDDVTGKDIPENGAMTNSFVTYEANGAQYIYDSFGVYTKFTGEAEVPVLSVNGKIGRVVLTTSDLENDSDYVTTSYVSEAIGVEASERERDDLALSGRIDTVSSDLAAETLARQNADTALGGRIDGVQSDLTAEATTRGNADTALQNSVNSIDTAINKDVITDLYVDPTTSTTVVELDATKTNIKTSTTATSSIPLPVASTTQAGVMNAATYNAIAQNTQDIANIKGEVVAISGLPASPTQAELTTAWLNESGEPALINGAGIYDVTNEKRWTYYSNDTTWHWLDAHGSVQVNQWTNSAAGIVKGSTSTGQIFAEADGTGSVNGWDTLSGQVATNTSKLATIEQGAQANVQANWTEADSTADSYIQNKPTIPTKTSDLNNDSNFITGTDVGSQIVPVYINNGIATAAKVNASGANWNIIPQVRGDGVMEVGKFIDFHMTNTGTTDQDARLANIAAGVLKIENDNGDYKIRKDANTDFSMRTIATTASYIGSTVGQPSSLAYVGSANIQDGAVTTAKIADLNVTEGKLASNSVTTNKIADGSVTSDKIDWATITEELYYNDSPAGSTASISLAKPISNYRSIDVCYKDDQLFSRVSRVYTNYATGTVNFVLDMSKSSAVTNTIFISSRRCEANGQTIAIGIERNANITDGSSPVVATSTNLKIYAVYGNKY